MFFLYRKPYDSILPLVQWIGEYPWSSVERAQHARDASQVVRFFSAYSQLLFNLGVQGRAARCGRLRATGTQSHLSASYGNLEREGEGLSATKASRHPVKRLGELRTGMLAALREQLRCSWEAEQ